MYIDGMGPRQSMAVEILDTVRFGGLDKLKQQKQNNKKQGVAEGSDQKKPLKTHKSGCGYNYGHDCDCGETLTHASDCHYNYGHDCDCGLDKIKGANGYAKKKLDNGDAYVIPFGLSKNIFGAVVIFAPKRLYITYRLNGKDKTVRMTNAWEVKRFLVKQFIQDM